MTKDPTSGQVYRHRKHAPAAGKWHEYRVVCVVLPGPGLEDSPRYFTAEHTETGNWHDIIPAAGSPTAKSGDARNWAWPEVEQAHVCYKNTRDDSGKCWLRPLDEFNDGRFTLLSSPDDEKQRIRAEILKLLTPTIDKAVEEIMNCRYRTQGTIEFVTKAVLKEMS